MKTPEMLKQIQDVSKKNENVKITMENFRNGMELSSHQKRLLSS